MAINQILGDSNPMVHTEISVTQDSNTVAIPQSPNEIDFCYCDFECEYIEKVYCLTGGKDYQNDKSMFLFENVDDSGTIVFKIFKNGVETATITDNTLGTYYAKGGFTNTTYTDHSNKSGLVVEWLKVFNTYGYGVYHFEIDITNFGTTITTTSRKFKLTQYKDTSVDHTVVIKGVQNGYIQGGLDYEGLNWSYQFRISGKLFNLAPDYEKTTYLNSSRVVKQIQAQVIRNYELTLDFIPAKLQDFIINDWLLSNEISVIDYNLFNAETLSLTEVFLVPESVDDLENFDRSRNSNISMTFKEMKQDKIKRNFK